MENSKNTFSKGNFSFNLEAELPNKTDFKKVWAGKLNVDIDSLYDELKKSHSAYNKPKKRATKEEKAEQ